MKTIIMLFVLSLTFVIPCWAIDYTVASNPDGRIGSFIWTIGGSFGPGSVNEKVSDTYSHLTYEYTLRSYSFLCKMEHPASRNLTFILQVRYSNTKISDQPYEAITSGFEIGMYFKIF